MFLNGARYPYQKREIRIFAAEHLANIDELVSSTKQIQN